MLKELLHSKKAAAVAAGIVTWGLGRIGLDVPAEELIPVLELLGWYVVGQGVADAGKYFKASRSVADALGAQPIDRSAR